MITSKTLSTVCFLTIPRPGWRGGLVRNLNSLADVRASFCQQVDDWMLLEVTENRAIYTRKNKTRTVPFIRACLIEDENSSYNNVLIYACMVCPTIHMSLQYDPSYHT